jgi:hypothetical protein|tara:strand:- start:185 stop:328 length:144 start_codon:yes stop_codon:yes gene_type:complete
MKLNKTFIIWIFLVILWNFGVPGATPIFDVMVAVALSFLSKCLERKI